MELLYCFDNILLQISVYNCRKSFDKQSPLLNDDARWRRLLVESPEINSLVYFSNQENVKVLTIR